MRQFDNFRPLHLTLAKASTKVNDHVLFDLLLSNVNGDELSSHESRRGQTYMHLAAKYNNVYAIKRLHEKQNR